MKCNVFILYTNSYHVKNYTKVHDRARGTQDLKGNPLKV